MNTKFTSSLLVLMLLIGFNYSNAQLAGSYTVGGTTPNYATIADAITDLNARVFQPCWPF
ncbi:MAG: hypothetical protein IPP29_18395 [Bacteroidetes bacterium]|nr:hypothetical protein [Bacteroidota bacterium]